MNEKLPVIKPKQLIRALEKVGWYAKRQTGSHVLMVSESLKRVVPVPIHNRDLKTGTLHGIIRRAGLSAEELRRLL